jgi:hypothetical protein
VPALLVCTTCSAEKDPRRPPIPAAQRYTHPRIAAAQARAQAAEAPFFILSGVFGLLAEDAPVPWYDHALRPDEVRALVPQVADTLRAQGAQRVLFIAEPAVTPGWAPYHQVMVAACRTARVRLTVAKPDFDADT